MRECRGLILDADTLEVVSFPFTKFFNYGEQHAVEIDWNTAHCEEKIDGSLIKVVNLGENRFLISTNGTIDASKCEITNIVMSPFKTYGEMVKEGFKHYGLTEKDFPRLFRPGFTYMFEITSPYNHIVVKYDETKLSFLGMRNNSTFEETFFRDSELSEIFNTPEIYPLKNIDQCVSAAEKLGEDKEGFVVCDRNFNRIKVKSPMYVALSHLRCNGSLSHERALEIVRKNEIGEVVNYFPEFEKPLQTVKSDYESLVSDLEARWGDFLRKGKGLSERKDRAKLVGEIFRELFYVGFLLLDGKTESVRNWAETVSLKKLCRILGYKKQWGSAIRFFQSRKKSTV